MNLKLFEILNLIKVLNIIELLNHNLKFLNRTENKTRINQINFNNKMNF